MQEIGFSDIHPYIFADIKTSHLNKALSMLKEDSLIITNISTSSKTYKLGTTNLEVVFCFDEQLDNNDNRVSDILIPYTLRIEEISNERFNEIYSVDYVLSKSNGHREYSQIEFGNKEKLLDYFNEHNITNYQLTDSLYDDFSIKLNKKTL